LPELRLPELRLPELRLPELRLPELRKIYRARFTEKFHKIGSKEVILFENS
jgi:hypothetical protein